MTWKEFKDKVDKQLQEMEIPETTQILWIDIGLVDDVDVEREDTGVSIS